jgi:hypothetical protein
MERVFHRGRLQLILQILRAFLILRLAIPDFRLQAFPPVFEFSPENSSTPEPRCSHGTIQCFSWTDAERFSGLNIKTESSGC